MNKLLYVRKRTFEVLEDCISYIVWIKDFGPVHNDTAALQFRRIKNIFQKIDHFVWIDTQNKFTEFGDSQLL